MRLRFLLPVVSLALAIFLFRFGDLQAKEIAAGAHGSAFEGLPLEAAKARYIAYALNAPAWALLAQARNMRWSPTTLWNARDLLFLTAVGLMWYCLGLRLDRKFTNSKIQSAQGGRRGWALPLLSVLYGLFVCYSVFRDLLPVEQYGYLFPNLRPLWFVLIVLCWGGGIICFGLNRLPRRKET